MTRPSRPALLLLLAAVALSCAKEGPPPAAPEHVRLEGPAPAIAGAPAAESLLVVFSATWCIPCREEMPSLIALANAPPEGLAVVVLSRDGEMSDVERFFKGPPPPALNLRLETEDALVDAFDVIQLPTAFLISRGQLVARFVGKHDWNGAPMRALLEHLTGGGRGWRC